MKDNIELWLEQITDAVFSVDERGTVLSSNEGLSDLIGASKMELLNRSLWSLFSIQDYDKVHELFKTAKSGIPVNYEGNFTTLKNEVVVLKISLSQLYRVGTQSKIFGVAKDLTHIRQTEAALEKSSRKFDALIEQGSDVVSIIDSGGIFQYVSENLFSVLGFKPDHFLGYSFFAYIHPEDISRLEREFEELRKSGEQKQVIFRIKNVDGKWRWMESKARDMRHEPSVKGIVVNSRDVTENLMSRLALEESEKKYRAFFQNSLDGIILSAPTGEIFAANPAACEMFQMEEEELKQVGREGIVDSTDPRLAQALRQRRAKSKIKSELTFKRKDGSKFPVEVTSSIYRDANNEERSCVIIRDMTQQKDVEEQLVRSKEEYKSLFECNPIPSWIYNNETLSITEVNQAAIEEYGYSKEEFLQLKVTDLKLEEEVNDFLAYKRSIKGEYGAKKYGKVNHITKNGDSKTTNIVSYRFENTNKTLVVSQDLTEWEKVQNRLKNREKKLLTAQQIGRMGYWELNFKETSLFWTDEVYNIWERSRNTFDLTILNVYETVHPEDLVALKQEMGSAFDGVKELDLEHRILLPNGTMKWVHQKGQILVDSLGAPVGFEGTVQDITDYKMALEKLQVSESRQASLLQSQTNYLIRTNLTGNYTYCNKKFHTDFSWIFADGEVLGKCAFATLMEYHHEKVKKIFDECIQNPHKVYQIELDKVQKNKKPKHMLWDFICLTNSYGEPLEVQGVGIDITKRVEAENELREINTRYELVTKATSDAIWDWNGETNTLYRGQGFKELFGYKSFAETSETNWSDLIHPDDALRVKAKLNQVLADNQESWEDEYRFKKADGEYAFVKDKSYIIRGENGKAVRMVGAMQDVTQEKLWIKRLTRSEALYFGLLKEKEKMLESIGDGFFALDHNWVVTYWNAEAERILQCSKEKILGRKLVDIFDVTNSSFEAHYLKAVDENKTQRFEAFFEGTESWYEVNAYPSRDGLSIFFKDITDVKDTKFKLKELNQNLKTYTEELVTANKGLEQFSYIISHNLRAPVANILGLANVLERGDYPAEVRKEAMEGLVNNVKRLDKVMFDLNHILQVKNEFSEKKESIQLQDLVFSIQASLQNIIEKEEVEIQIDFSEHPNIISVPGYIHSIFYNLIFNSIKYRRAGVRPLIKISTKSNDEKIIILFEDNGMGIDLNKRKDQIFGLYKRFHNHVEGKGMGLFMVKTQVEMLGGKVSVSSEVGKGSTFTIELNKYKLKKEVGLNETVHSS